ncbi:MAG: flavodoxin domain-containing protein [Anaerolineae bacterium]
MSTQVLVAYASRHGATAEIAEKIGEVLSEAGFSTTVLPASQVKDLTPYQAVVLGSAVYMGQWLKEAADFLRDNQEELAKRMVWLFSSGPTGPAPVNQLLKRWRFPKSLLPIAERIQPRDIAVFHGALDVNKLSLPERMVVQGARVHLGDYRDWDLIAVWAEGIADALK